MGFKILTVGEMPSHTHSASSNWTGEHTHNIAYRWDNDDGTGWLKSGTTNTAENYKQTQSAGGHSHSISVGNTGNNNAHNNMQPYISCYLWKRIA